MDKKFMVLITAMVIVCIGILSWIYVFPDIGSKTISNISTAYATRFFDEDKVIDIHITLDDADYKDILQNPLAEEYKEAEIIVDGVKVTSVGLRTKGNSSLNSVARTESDRYSFKVDFSQYIRTQSLSGLTKLNLNNSFSDPSFMREYLSYSLLGEMGVATPAFGYVNLYINGELIGLYLAVEGLEEPFLERYYGSNYGTLYKPEGQGSDLIYVDDNISSYSGIEAQAGYNNNSNAALLTMLKALKEGRDLEQYLDVEQILRYFAVNTVLVNMDSYQGSFKHNYYLYEEDGVFTILPWDYNMSFGGFGMGGNNQDQTALYIDQPVSGTTLEQRPLLGKLLEVEEYKVMYHKYIEEFIEGTFALEKMTVEIDRIANLIRPYVESDPTKFFTMEQFEQALYKGSVEVPLESVSQQARPQGGMMGGNVIGLGNFVQERISNVAQQLSGEIPTYGDASSQAFERGNIIPGQDGQIPGGGRNQRPYTDVPEGFPEGRAFPGGEGFPDVGGGLEGRRLPGGAELPQGGRNPAGVNGIERNDQHVYLIGILVLFLSVIILLLFKKKTKHQI